MIDLLLRKVFGSKHERDVKRMRPRVAAINALEAEIGRWPDEAFRPRADELRQKLQDGVEVDEILPETFAMVREVGRRRLGMRHFDVAAHGRHDSPLGHDRGDGDRRGQDPGRHAPGRAERPHRSRRAHRHGERLPRPPRRPVDGPHLSPAGPLGVGHPARGLVPLRPGLRADRLAPPVAPPVPAAGGLPRRHHLRDEQRVRVRLPARQHAVLAGRAGPAGAPLRHRRRGRLHPDRRGADPADHLRPGGGVDGPLLQGRPDHSQAHPRGDDHRGEAPRDRGGPPGRLHRRREGEDGHPDRGGRRPVRAAALGREPLRPPAHRHAPPHQPGPPRPRPLPAGRGLRRQGRPDHHRRRVHGPPDARPALVGRPPPGDRGEGGAADPAGEPDPRHDHLPELLPDVRQARGHDGHRRHRGGGVREDLQARRLRDPAEPVADPGHPPGHRLQDRAREVRRRRPGGQGAPREGAADPDRHRLHREVRAALQAPQEERRARPPGAQRQVPREGSGDRRPGGPDGGGDHRHQHGRPRDGHPAGRQPGVPRPRDAAEARPGPGDGVRRGADPRAGGGPADHRGGARARRRAGGPPHPRHRAARVAADRQPAARPVGAPGRPRLVPLLPVARGRPPADLRLGADPEDHGPPRDGGRGADRARPGDAGDPDRPEARRGAPLRDPEAPPRVRRRDEQAARGDLRDAPRDPPGREPGGDRPRVDGRPPGRRRRHLRGRGRPPRGLGPGRARGGDEPAVRREAPGRRRRARGGVARGAARDAGGGGLGPLRRARAGAVDGPPADARAVGHAPRDRQPVEGPPPVDGPPQGGDRAPRVRPARPADRVQARGVRRLRGDGRSRADERHRAPVPDAGRPGGRARARAPTGAASRPCAPVDARR